MRIEDKIPSFSLSHRKVGGGGGQEERKNLASL